MEKTTTIIRILQNYKINDNLHHNNYINLHKALSLEEILDILHYPQPKNEEINLEKIQLGFLKIFINEFLEKKKIVISTTLRKNHIFDINVYHSMLYYILTEMNILYEDRPDKKSSYLWNQIRNIYQNFEFENRNWLSPNDSNIKINKDELTGKLFIDIENNKHDDYMYQFDDKDNYIFFFNNIYIKTKLDTVMDYLKGNFIYKKCISKYNDVIEENNIDLKNPHHESIIQDLCLHFYALSYITTHLEVSRVLFSKCLDSNVTDDDHDENDESTIIDDSDDTDNSIDNDNGNHKNNDDDDDDDDDDDRHVHGSKRKLYKLEGVPPKITKYY